MASPTTTRDAWQDEVDAGVAALVDSWQAEVDAEVKELMEGPRPDRRIRAERLTRDTKLRADRLTRDGRVPKSGGSPTRPIGPQDKGAPFAGSFEKQKQAPEYMQGAARREEKARAKEKFLPDLKETGQIAVDMPAGAAHMVSTAVPEMVEGAGLALNWLGKSLPESSPAHRLTAEDPSDAWLVKGGEAIRKPVDDWFRDPERPWDPDSTAYKLGGAVGSTASLLLPTTASGQLARLAGWGLKGRRAKELAATMVSAEKAMKYGLRGERAAQIAGTAVGGGSLNAPSMYREILMATGDPEKALNGAMVQWGFGTIEAAPFIGMFHRMDIATGGQLTKLLLTSMAEGAEEFAQEAFQTLGENFIAKWVSEHDKDREWMQDVWSRGKEGSAGGAFLGILGYFLGAKQRRQMERHREMVEAEAYAQHQAHMSIGISQAPEGEYGENIGQMRVGVEQQQRPPGMGATPQVGPESYDDVRRQRRDEQHGQDARERWQQRQRIDAEGEDIQRQQEHYRTVQGPPEPGPGWVGRKVIVDSAHRWKAGGPQEETIVRAGAGFIVTRDANGEEVTFPSRYLDVENSVIRPVPAGPEDTPFKTPPGEEPMGPGRDEFAGEQARRRGEALEQMKDRRQKHLDRQRMEEEFGAPTGPPEGYGKDEAPLPDEPTIWGGPERRKRKQYTDQERRKRPHYDRDLAERFGLDEAAADLEDTQYIDSAWNDGMLEEQAPDIVDATARVAARRMMLNEVGAMGEAPMPGPITSFGEMQAEMSDRLGGAWDTMDEPLQKHIYSEARKLIDGLGASLDKAPAEPAPTTPPSAPEGPAGSAPPAPAGEAPTPSQGTGYDDYRAKLSEDEQANLDETIDLWYDETPTTSDATRRFTDDTPPTDAEKELIREAWAKAAADNPDLGVDELNDWLLDKAPDIASMRKYLGKPAPQKPVRDEKAEEEAAAARTRATLARADAIQRIEEMGGATRDPEGALERLDDAVIALAQLDGLDTDAEDAAITKAHRAVVESSRDQLLEALNKVSKLMGEGTLEHDRRLALVARKGLHILALRGELATDRVRLAMPQNMVRQAEDVARLHGQKFNVQTRDPEANTETDEEIDEAVRTGRRTMQKGEPWEVGWMLSGDIAIDAERFQYKQDSDSKGVVRGDPLQTAEEFNPDIMGIIMVWEDPETGEILVVNGHQRLNRAKQDGPDVPMKVEFIPAKTASDAKAAGALINIGEGKGTAIDTATFMKETDTTLDDLKDGGIPSTKAKNIQASRLVNLDDFIFRQVANGSLSIPQGAEIGRAKDKEAQKAVLSMFLKMSHQTNDKLKELVDELGGMDVEGRPQKEAEQKKLPGADEMSQAQLKALEARVSIKAKLGELLRQPNRAFRAMSQKSNEALYKQHDVQVDREQAERIGKEAATRIAAFEQLKDLAGGDLNEAINNWTQSVVDGDRTVKEAADEIAKRIDTLIENTLHPDAAGTGAESGPDEETGSLFDQVTTYAAEGGAVPAGAVALKGYDGGVLGALIEEGWPNQPSRKPGVSPWKTEGSLVTVQRDFTLDLNDGSEAKVTVYVHQKDISKAGVLLRDVAARARVHGETWDVAPDLPVARALADALVTQMPGVRLVGLMGDSAPWPSFTPEVYQARRNDHYQKVATGMSDAFEAATNAIKVMDEKGSDTPGISTYISALKERLRSADGAVLTGLRFNSIEEIASEMRAHRDPAFEHLRIFAVKRNKDGTREVVAELHYTSRSGDQVSLARKGQAPSVAFDFAIKGMLYHQKHNGATEFIMQHNHPSGHAEPSKADLSLTKSLAAHAEAQGLNITDHVVINHTTFGHIRKEKVLGKERWVKTAVPQVYTPKGAEAKKRVGTAGRDPLDHGRRLMMKQLGLHPDVNIGSGSETEAFRTMVMDNVLGQTNANPSILIMNTHGVAVTLGNVDPAVIKAVDFLKYAEAHGGSLAVIYVPQGQWDSNKNFQQEAIAAYTRGWVNDIIIQKHVGASYSAAAESMINTPHSGPQGSLPLSSFGQQRSEMTLRDAGGNILKRKILKRQLDPHGDIEEAAVGEGTYSLAEEIDASTAPGVRGANPELQRIRKARLRGEAVERMGYSSNEARAKKEGGKPMTREHFDAMADDMKVEHLKQRLDQGPKNWSYDSRLAKWANWKRWRNPAATAAYNGFRVKRAREHGYKIPQIALDSIQEATAGHLMPEQSVGSLGWIEHRGVRYWMNALGLEGMYPHLKNAHLGYAQGLATETQRLAEIFGQEFHDRARSAWNQLQDKKPGKKPDILKKSGRDDRARIMEAMMRGEIALLSPEHQRIAQDLRHWFNEMHDRAAQAGILDPEQYIEDYIPFVRKHGMQKWLKHKGWTPESVPSNYKPFFSMHRNGELYTREDDLGEILMAYIRAFNRALYLEPAIQHYIGPTQKGGRSRLDAAYTEGKITRSQLQAIHDYFDHLRGKPHEAWDKAEERVAWTMKQLQKMTAHVPGLQNVEFDRASLRSLTRSAQTYLYAANLGIRLSSPVKNATQQFHTAALLAGQGNSVREGLRLWAKGLATYKRSDAMKELIAVSGVTSDFLPLLEQAGGLLNAKVGEMMQKSLFMFAAVDTINRGVTFAGAYQQFIEALDVGAGKNLVDLPTFGASGKFDLPTSFAEGTSPDMVRAVRRSMRGNDKLRRLLEQWGALGGYGRKHSAEGGESVTVELPGGKKSPGFTGEEQGGVRQIAAQMSRQGEVQHIVKLLRQGQLHQAAVEYAKSMVYEAQYGYGTADSPLAWRKPIWRSMSAFHTWPFYFIELGTRQGAIAARGAKAAALTDIGGPKGLLEPRKGTEYGDHRASMGLAAMKTMGTLYLLQMAFTEGMEELDIDVGSWFFRGKLFGIPLPFGSILSGLPYFASVTGEAAADAWDVAFAYSDYEKQQALRRLKRNWIYLSGGRAAAGLIELGMGEKDFVEATGFQHMPETDEEKMVRESMNESWGMNRKAGETMEQANERQYQENFSPEKAQENLIDELDLPPWLRKELKRDLKEAE